MLARIVHPTNQFFLWLVFSLILALPLVSNGTPAPRFAGLMVRCSIPPFTQQTPESRQNTQETQDDMVSTRLVEDLKSTMRRPRLYLRRAVVALPRFGLLAHVPVHVSTWSHTDLHTPALRDFLLPPLGLRAPPAA